MPITSAPGGLWADALDDIVKFRANEAFNRRASLIPTLFNMQTSSRAYEAVSGVGAISPDAFENYKNSGVIPEVDFDQMYKATYTHVEYPIDFSVERKTIDDTMFNEVYRVADRIGDSAAVFRESKAASVFNNAVSSSYLGPDGVALLSDSHPLSPMKTGSTQDNKYALSLTRDNLRTAREAMMAFTDDNGNKLAVTPDMLLVPPALEDDAIEIVNSLQNPNNANNTINPMAGRFRVLPWHYLTDSNRWFLIDSNRMRMSLDWFDRVPFSVYMREGDDRTVRAYWRAYQRFSYGWSDWKWVLGSEPS